MTVLLQAVRAVAAGGHHTVAVLDSAVYAWGSNRCGQLGTRTFRDRDTPAEVRRPCAGSASSSRACSGLR